MSSDGENGVTVEVPAHEPDEASPLTLRRVVLGVLLAAVVVVAVAGLLDRPKIESKTVPQTLVGEWTSDHPEYSDRYVTITPGSITFGVGGTSAVKYSVIGIERPPEDDGATLILHFRDVAGTKFARGVVVDESGGSWFFVSQPAVVWRR